MDRTPLAHEARAELDALDAALAADARDHAAPASAPPVHTVYGGAHLFRRGTAQRLGALALAALDRHAPDPWIFASALGLDGAGACPTDASERAAHAAAFDADPRALRAASPDAWRLCAVYAKVREKLAREPVEDYRVDFEDGFGVRADAEEDAAADAAVRELAAGHAEGTLPRGIGIRIKALDAATSGRAVATLERVVDGLADRGAVPAGFVVTLPKVSHPAQPRALASLCARLERRHGLPAGALGIELMIELPRAVIASDGAAALPRLLEASEGRCRAVHFGTYDYTAACDVLAAHQSMAHPLARFALHVTQNVAVAAGVRLSDGATNVMPVGATADVHAAWRLMHQHVRGSIEGGIHQGWDLHPAQLPVRFATHHAIVLADLDASTARLKHFLDAAAQASRLGHVFDDAATGQGLLNHFLRGLSCGALSLDDLAAAGLTEAELRGRSFGAILAGRRA